LSQFGRSDGSEWTAVPVDPIEVVESAAAMSASVALSYSEPSLAMELTVALAEAGRARGVDVVWKSNGFLTARAAEVAADHVAAVNVDIKGVDDRRHRRLTGAPIAPVIDTIRLFRERGVWVEVSTPLIPGVSTDPADLTAVAETIADIDPLIPWHLLRFTPTYEMAGEAPSSPADLARAREIGYQTGLRFVYVERALGASGRTTWCPSCAAAVVERGIWEVTGDNVVGSACGQCGTYLPGRW
jgi:pyruvate formate lyase activating enzyme